ncbi:MAG: hypothetical protein Q9170_001827 [Blastenia crenularia]
MAPSLATLPPETLNQIIHSVEKNGHLLNLALSCHAFYDLILPVLYSHITIRGSDIRVPHERFTHLESLATRLLCNPTLASHVRDITVDEEWSDKGYSFDDYDRAKALWEDLVPTIEKQRPNWPKEQRNEWVKQASRGYENALMALLLRVLPNLELMDIVIRKSSVDPDTHEPLHSGDFVTKLFTRAVDKGSLEDVSIRQFPNLRIIINSCDSREGTPLDLLHKYVQLPSIRRIYVHRQFSDEYSPMASLEPGCCPTLEHLELRNSRLSAADLEGILGASSSLKTFVYNLCRDYGHQRSYRLPKLGETLSAIKKSLENLWIDYWIDGVSLGRGDDLLPIVNLSEFPLLKNPKLDMYLLFGMNNNIEYVCNPYKWPADNQRIQYTHTEQAPLESRIPNLGALLPESLETIYFSCTEGRIGILIQALTRLLQIKESCVPHLKEIAVEVYLTGNKDAPSFEHLQDLAMNTGIQLRVIDSGLLGRKSGYDHYGVIDPGRGLDGSVSWAGAMNYEELMDLSTRWDRARLKGHRSNHHVRQARFAHMEEDIQYLCVPIPPDPAASAHDAPPKRSSLHDRIRGFIARLKTPEASLLFAKFKWMLLSIVVPEFVLGKALAERWAAQESWRQAGVDGWTTMHAFFTNMRGFIPRFKVSTVEMSTVPSKPDEMGRSLHRLRQGTIPDGEAPYYEQDAIRAEVIESIHCRRRCGTSYVHSDEIAIGRYTQEGLGIETPIGEATCKNPSQCGSAKTGHGKPATYNALSTPAPALYIPRNLSRRHTAEPLTLLTTPTTLVGSPHTPSYCPSLSGHSPSSSHTRDFARPYNTIASTSVAENATEPLTDTEHANPIRPTTRHNPPFRIDPPEALKDRSKGDSFIKGFAILQITTLVIQIIARSFQDLATTLIEVNVLAFAACAIVTYILLWHKLQDVKVPVYIDIPTTLTRDQIIKLAARAPVATLLIKDFWLHGVSIRAQADNIFPWTPGIRFNIPFTKEPLLVSLVILGIGGGGLIFGAVHFVAWNFNFPTPIERLLWRISCTVLVFFPLLGTAFYWVMQQFARREGALDKELNRALRPMCYVIGIVYLAARGYLVVEILERWHIRNRVSSWRMDKVFDDFLAATHGCREGL